MWLAFTHVGGKYSPPCRNGAPSTLSASLWSGLCYQISLIEERPFLFDFRSKRLSFFLHLDVFLSFLKFATIPRISAYGFSRMDFRGWSCFFLVFVFPTRCVRVNSSVGDGLGGFRLPLTYGCSLSPFCRTVYGCSEFNSMVVRPLPKKKREP